AIFEARAKADENRERDCDEDSAEDDRAEERADDHERRPEHHESQEREEHDARHPPLWPSLGADVLAVIEIAHSTTMPSFAACTTASVRVSAPSLARIALTWNFTV